MSAAHPSSATRNETIYLSGGHVFLGASADARAAGNYLSMGTAGHQAFELDMDSIERQGNEVRFRVRSTSTLNGPVIVYEGLVGVDCQKRTRAEYENMTSIDHRVGAPRAVAGDMKTVFDGTRQAEELNTVCALARHAPANRTHASMAAFAAAAAAADAASTSARRADPTVAPLSPLTKNPAVLPSRTERLYASSTGLVLSPLGLLLVSDVVVGGCARVEAVLPGASPSRAVVIARDVRRGYALLRVAQLAATEPLPRSAAGASSGEAVIVVGYPSRDSGNALPVAAAGVVWGRTAAGADRVVILASRPLVSGVVLDEQGAVLGLVDGLEAFKPGQRGMGMTSGPALGALLGAQRLSWLSGAPSVPEPKLQGALRRAIAGTALVSCYMNS